MDVCCGNDCGWNTSSEKCKSSPRIYRGEVGLWSDTRKEPWEPGPAAAGKRGRTPGGPAGQPARQPARPFPAPPSVPHACLWAGAGLSLPLCNTVRSSPSHHPRPLLGVLNNNFQTNCEMERILQQTNAMCLLPGSIHGHLPCLSPTHSSLHPWALPPSLRHGSKGNRRRLHAALEMRVIC